MSRKIRFMLSSLLAVVIVLSGTIAAHAATPDEAAKDYLIDHRKNPHGTSVECGQVIQFGGAISLPAPHGASNDVIGPLLDGLGVSRIHEWPIRSIATKYTSAASEADYIAFSRELSNYIAQNQVNYRGVAGLVHCHPGN